MYAIFTMLCRNKPECNEIHPYISFIPVYDSRLQCHRIGHCFFFLRQIVSYIVLRNISGLLRVRHSIFFARIGKISLEVKDYSIE